ncbi:MAG: endo alpha-1,4 polygalactosaminidase [Deltaproteobacteria bacterium]|nr:endo alpha-1,4 polygalactosaminidase [Deltaproteobacteria bacterium]
MSVIRRRIAAMRSLHACGLVSLALAVGCGDDGEPLVPDGIPSDAFEPTYWTPAPGEAANWDIQLVAPFDTSAARQMYLVDLWAITPGGTIDYGNGETVTVPAGALTASLSDIKAGGILVCQVTVGAIRLTDPDAMRYPGFEATPPDRPTDPAANSVIGWSVIGDANTRFLDIREAARTGWEATMYKRFQHAKDIGCDAVDAIWIDRNTGDYGFPLETIGDQNDISLYYRDVVADLHAKEISAGYHSSTPIGNLFSDQFSATYDFAVVERCAEFDVCGEVMPFEQAGKATFGLDFLDDGTTDRDGDTVSDGISFSGGCLKAGLQMDWLHKDADAAFRPSSTYRMSKAECD